MNSDSVMPNFEVIVLLFHFDTLNLVLEINLETTKHINKKLYIYNDLMN
jgi:hypothetical protein